MTAEPWLLLAFLIADTLFLLRLTSSPIDRHVAAQRVSRLGTRAVLASIGATLIAFLVGALRSFASDGPPQIVDAQIASGRLSMTLTMCIGVPFIGAMWLPFELRRRRLSQRPN